jgi:hypothetical protein
VNGRDISALTRIFRRAISAHDGAIGQPAH